MSGEHDGRGSAGAPAGSPPVDFSALYDEHPDYVARRAEDSFERAQIDVEVRLFKLPHLLALLPSADAPHRVLEIGCATGELIAAMPVSAGGTRTGIDISAANVAVARARFPHVQFLSGDFRSLPADAFDAVVLSDVLEHVPDAVEFLRDAAALAPLVLVNLPLEDNWLNRGRAYGPADVSGHLRRYDLVQGLALVEQAGLQVVASSRVWVHETPAEAARRALRRQWLGSAYAGTWPMRQARRAVFGLAGAVRPLGRRLFASNLFVAARRAPSALPGVPQRPGVRP